MADNFLIRHLAFSLFGKKKNVFLLFETFIHCIFIIFTPFPQLLPDLPPLPYTPQFVSSFFFNLLNSICDARVLLSI